MSQATSTTNKHSALELQLRPMRLALNTARTQIALGVAASDAVNGALDITERYCEKQVHFDIISNVIFASMHQGIDKEPLTLMITVNESQSNNMLVQEIQELIHDVAKGKLLLEEAEKRLEKIYATEKTYPQWQRTVASAGVGVGAVMLFTSSWIVITMTFLIGLCIDWITRKLSNRVPPFFVQSVAATFVTLSAIGVAELGRRDILPFVGVDPTLIVVGGIIMLVAGLMLYATAEDAIDQFYVTAGARFIKTFMMTAGIVTGIMVGLGITHILGSTVAVSPDPVPLGVVPVQIGGAVIIAMSWALYTQSHRTAIMWAGIISGLVWIGYLITMPFGDFAASGIGATIAGFLSAMVARLSKSPSIALVNAAVIPLVPGLSLYNGLMQFILATDATSYSDGQRLLITALGIALAIAAGSAFGYTLGRPVRSNIILARTYVPELVRSIHKKKIHRDDR